MSQNMHIGDSWMIAVALYWTEGSQMLFNGWSADMTVTVIVFIAGTFWRIDYDAVPKYHVSWWLSHTAHTAMSLLTLNHDHRYDQCKMTAVAGLPEPAHCRQTVSGCLMTLLSAVTALAASHLQNPSHQSGDQILGLLLIGIASAQTGIQQSQNYRSNNRR